MNINWRRTALGELETETGGVIQTGPFGSQLHMSDYSDEGTPVVMPTNIRDMRIDPTDIARVGDEHVDRLVRHQLRPGDILYSRRGDVEKCALVTEHETGWLCGTGCLLVRVQGEHIDTRFLAYQLSTPAKRGWIRQHAVGLTMLNLNTGILREIPIELPDFEEQRRIASVLGALDDKIESNLRVRNLCRDLGGNLVADTVRSAPSTQLEHYAASISRGVTPQYYKGEDASPVLVLNQKCIRDGWVTPELARLMAPRAREKSQAIARLDDLLVNSTGQGTLGRVARWDSDDPIYVDSHVTVVKADPRRIYPVLMPYLVFPLQDEIEHMATGSTGQTELSPSRLAQLNVPLLSLKEQMPLSARLVALEAQAHYCQVQSLKLTELRDALLPELMSGRMRVDEAGRLVSEALDGEVADV